MYCLNVANKSGQFETVFNYYGDEGWAEAEARAKAAQDELVKNGLICGVSTELLTEEVLSESEYRLAAKILREAV
jgi:hypothetical protein